MTQNHILILGFIEIIVFILIIHYLGRINKWINEKQNFIEELSCYLPEYMKNLRIELESFNKKIKEEFTPKPLSPQELGTLIGGLIADFGGSRIPFLPAKNKFFAISMLMRLWRYRRRLKATFTNRYLKTD